MGIAGSFSRMLADKQMELLARSAAERKKQRGGFSEEALLWMALTPGWTAPLAKAAGFPIAESTLDQLAAEGFCSTTELLAEPVVDPTTGRSSLAPAGKHYSMSGQMSREVLEEVIQDPGRGRTAIQLELPKIGEALLKAESAGVALQPAQRNWALLAAKVNDPGELYRFLLGEVDKALASDRFADAVAWVEAAFPHEQLLKGRVAEAVHLASLRIQLRQRIRDNQRHLVRFLERREQILVFEELLAGKDATWALHFTGLGGVGKTMLMRHLENRVAPGRGASSARIDFDYLNPEYPSTKPALLLLQLAEELRLHDKTGAASAYFETFSFKALAFHEGLTGASRAGESPLDLIRDPEFQLLLDTFAGFARNLPQPVILMLDTCEELSKMLPDGTVPESVSATFEILEDLHKRLPKIRVVFCGRRPLASKGAGGWRVAGTQGLARDPKPYLRLHEIRGFNQADAERYLREKAQCPEKLIPAILKKCPERGHTPQFLWESRRKAPTIEPRYSPFELALYGAWAREDPGLEVKTIESADVDQYVRMRIVGRIQNAEILALLPVIAWLGRFDLRAVEALSGEGADQAATRRLFEELSSQEWIDRQHSQFLEVERGLRPRLLSYFRGHDIAGLEQARQLAAAYLEDLTLNRPFPELDISHFEALLSVLMTEPERAGRWWRRVEANVAGNNAYPWILPVTTRLLAEENWAEAVASDAAHIRAGILATHAAAQIHTSGRFVAERTWGAVLADADRHPDAGTARQLRLRANAAQGIVGDFVSGDMTEQLAATLVSGIEERLEKAEGGVRIELPAPEAIVRLAGVIRDAGLSHHLRAFSLLLAGRALVQAKREAEATWLFKDALAMARVPGPGGAGWLDWVGPADLRSRIGLEFLRWAYPAVLGPRELLWWFEMPETLTGLDSDRLASAILLLESAARPMELNRLDERVSRSIKLTDGHEVASQVHHRYPPFCVAAAEEMARQCEVERAIGILQSQSSVAESGSVSYDTVLAADRALTRIIRAFRLFDEGHVVRDSVRTSDLAEDQWLAWSTDLLGPPASRQPLAGERAAWEIPRTEELIEKIGPRRLALTALEHGAILAIDGDDRSLELLEFAHDRFVRGQDWPHATIAATCIALALARLGRIDLLKSRLDALKQLFHPPVSHSEAIGNFLGPESWKRIENTVEGSSGAWIDVQPAWTRPWLFRIAACLALERDRRHPADRIGRVYVAWRKFIDAMPAEVAGWLLEQPVSASQPAGGHAAALRPPAPLAEPVVTFHAVRARSGGSIFERANIEIVYQDAERHITTNVETPPPEMPYAEAAGRLAVSIPDLFAFHARKVLVPPSCAWVCWEAMLALPHPFPRRIARPSLPAARFGSPPAVHTLTLNHIGADLAGSGWRLPWTYAQTPRELMVKTLHAQEQVLHIIAEPIETRAGIRLRLTEEVVDEKSDRGTLLRSDEAIKILPNVQLAVLQLPIARRIERSGVDREKAGYLRTFAAELHAAGFPCVITIPSLEFDLAREVLESIANVLREPVSGTSEALFDAGMIKAKGVIVSRMGDGAMTRETADDICFYGETDVPVR